MQKTTRAPSGAQAARKARAWLRKNEIRRRRSQAQQDAGTRHLSALVPYVGEELGAKVRTALATGLGVRTWTEEDWQTVFRVVAAMATSAEHGNGRQQT